MHGGGDSGFDGAGAGDDRVPLVGEAFQRAPHPLPLGAVGAGVHVVGDDQAGAAEAGQHEPEHLALDRGEVAAVPVGVERRVGESGAGDGGGVGVAAVGAAGPYRGDRNQPAPAARHRAEQQQAFGDVLGDGERRVGFVHARHLAERGRAAAAQLAVVVREAPGQRQQQRGAPAAGRAGDGVQLTARGGEVDVAVDPAAAGAQPQAPGLDDVHPDPEFRTD